MVKIVLTVTAVAAFSLVLIAGGEQEKVSGDDVPAAVRDALGQVNVREIERESENGCTVYEVELVVAGEEVELKLNPEGKVLKLEVEDKKGSAASKKSSEKQEQEREVKESEVPAAAIKTLKQLVGDAEIHEFAEEIEYGHTFYEGSWKSPSGHNMDVLVTETGDLVEIEERVDADKVPSGTMKAARQAAGKDAEMRFEKKTALYYEVKFSKDGRRHELLLTPDGRRVEEEIEDRPGRDEEEDDD